MYCIKIGLLGELSYFVYLEILKHRGKLVKGMGKKPRRSGRNSIVFSLFLHSHPGHLSEEETHT